MNREWLGDGAGEPHGVFVSELQRARRAIKPHGHLGQVLLGLGTARVPSAVHGRLAPLPLMHGEQHGFKGCLARGHVRLDGIAKARMHLHIAPAHCPPSLYPSARVRAAAGRRRASSSAAAGALLRAHVLLFGAHRKEAADILDCARIA